MLAQTAKYLAVYLISMIKFIGGPLSGVASGLTWVETFIFTVLGMMTTVVVLTLLGENARKRFLHRLRKKKKLFTPKNRRMVRMWRKYGLKGVAFLTPVFFSPIIGTVMAISFGEPAKRIFFYMLGSALFWGVIFSLFINELNSFIFHRV
ncbi:small multi-drug export protein [Rhodocytophaga aerolata]|nr:small multi-drug export protein [Rhodocytophaga aerolata]